MTNMSIQPLWLTYFIEILLVLEFQPTKTYFGTFSYKAHFRPQISSNGLVHGVESVLPIECQIPSLRLVIELLPDTSPLEEQLLQLEQTIEYC